jgi:hypothetical protein
MELCSEFDHSVRDKSRLKELGLEPRTYGLKGRCSTN